MSNYICCLLYDMSLSQGCNTLLEYQDKQRALEQNLSLTMYVQRNFAKDLLTAVNNDNTSHPNPRIRLSVRPSVRPYLIFVIFVRQRHFQAWKRYAKKVRKFTTKIASRQNNVKQYYGVKFTYLFQQVIRRRKMA